MQYSGPWRVFAAYNGGFCSGAGELFVLCRLLVFFFVLSPLCLVSFSSLSIVPCFVSIRFFFALSLFFRVCLSHCIVIFVFWVVGEFFFSPSPDKSYPSLLQSPLYLAHTFTVALPPTMIPAGFLTRVIPPTSRLGWPTLRRVSYYSTPPTQLKYPQKINNQE